MADVRDDLQRVVVFPPRARHHDDVGIVHLDRTERVLDALGDRDDLERTVVGHGSLDLVRVEALDGDERADRAFHLLATASPGR